MIIWITGLSAAGKTTIGREVYHLWRSDEPNTVFIDGDENRQNPWFGQIWPTPQIFRVGP